MPEAAAEYVLHEYIWLGGRPVAVVKTALDASYNRMTAKSCWRNNEYDECETAYPVSDYLPKVVAVLDGAGRLAGAADYDAFGRVNEVSKRADVPAPRPGPATEAYPTGRYPFGAYTPNQNVDLAVLSQPWGSSRQRVQMRVNYAQVNTPGGMASSTDKTWVTLGSGAQVAPTPTPEERWYAGRLYATSTNWFEAPANGDVRVKWASGPTQQPQEYTGATVRSYEHRRFELGAQPTWVALRFPGQYADAETGLFENWNRFYDPSTRLRVAASNQFRAHPRVFVWLPDHIRRPARWRCAPPGDPARRGSTSTAPFTTKPVGPPQPCNPAKRGS